MNGGIDVVILVVALTFFRVEGSRGVGGPGEVGEFEFSLVDLRVVCRVGWIVCIRDPVTPTELGACGCGAGWESGDVSREGNGAVRGWLLGGRVGGSVGDGERDGGWRGHSEGRWGEGGV